jgi:hypothetical protein
VGLKLLKSLNLTNGYPNKNNNNKVKSKPLELFELAGKKSPHRSKFSNFWREKFCFRYPIKTTLQHQKVFCEQLSIQLFP